MGAARRARRGRRCTSRSAGPSPPAPLRVVILGWACLSLQAREGSGYNLCVTEVAAGLAGAGHRIYYLRSGIDYSVRPGMWIKPREVWRGISCFDYVNSPNLASANCNFKNVRSQVNSAAPDRDSPGLAARGQSRPRPRPLPRRLRL